MKSMDKVIQEISFRLRRLELCGRLVRVVDRVTDEMSNELYKSFQHQPPITGSSRHLSFSFFSSRGLGVFFSNSLSDDNF